MVNVFITSDTHFGHKKIVTFTGVHGTKLRPWDTVEEMNEAMVERWNSVVKPNDKVYHLGDAALGSKSLGIFRRLNGNNVLIKGNHDMYDAEEYLAYFRDIRSCHKIDDYLLSHIPIHPGSIERYEKGNIHGHLHDGRVLLDNGKIDRRYICASVEHSNFTPIPFEEIEKYR